MFKFLGHLPYISKFPSFGAYNILNLMLENQILFHLSNKGTDQAAFPSRHISFCVIHYQENMEVQHDLCKILINQLVCVAELAGLTLIWL